VSGKKHFFGFLKKMIFSINFFWKTPFLVVFEAFYPHFNPDFHHLGFFGTV